MRDVATVFWKETRELLTGSVGRGKLGLVIFVIMFGVVLPLQTREAWVRSPATLVSWAWVPLFLVTSIIADSIAGERERHTLESLLATPLSDGAILLGKVFSAMAYGLGVTWTSLLTGLVTVNLASPGGFLCYPARVLLSILGVSLLTALLGASGGVLVSVRAPSVRQAQQTLSIATMVLLFGPLLAAEALPATWKASMVEALRRAGPSGVVVSSMALLGIMDVALLVAARKRFKRSRLILD